jgi:hypothetical protein
MLSVLLGSARRLGNDESMDRTKEVLLKFSHSAENKRLLSRVLTQMDDDARIRLAFLNLS